MRGRWPQSLAVALLLSLVVTTIGHEHVGEAAHATDACVVDHARDEAPTPPASTPRLASAGERHEHQCLGCRLGNQRITLASKIAGQHVGATTRSAFVPDWVAHERQPVTGHTSRGPPPVRVFLPRASHAAPAATC